MAKLVKKEHKNITILSNKIVKDKTLSWKARGIFTFLWSRPNDWSFSEAEVKKNSLQDGMTSLRNGLKELENHKYLAIKYPGNSSVGVGHSEWILSDKPMRSSVGYRKTVSERRSSNVDNRKLLNTDNTKHSNKQNTDHTNLSREREFSKISNIYQKWFINETDRVMRSINSWLVKYPINQIISAMKTTRDRCRTTNPNAVVGYVSAVLKDSKSESNSHLISGGDNDDSKYDKPFNIKDL